MDTKTLTKIRCRKISNLLDLYNQSNRGGMAWSFRHLDLVDAMMNGEPPFYKDRYKERVYHKELERPRKMSDSACRTFEKVIDLIIKYELDDILELEEYLTPELRSFVHTHIEEVNYFLEAQYKLNDGKEKDLVVSDNPKAIYEIIIAYKIDNLLDLSDWLEENGNETLQYSLTLNTTLYASMVDAMMWRTHNIN